MSKRIDQMLGLGNNDLEDDLEDDLLVDIEVIPEECNFDKDNPDNDISEDYIFIRKKLRYSVAACEKVLDQALRSLITSPTPRGIEGCSTIIKTITDCTGQLLDTHSKIKKMVPPKKDEKEELNDDGSIKSFTVNDVIEQMKKDETFIDDEVDWEDEHEEVFIMDN